MTVFERAAAHPTTGTAPDELEKRFGDWHDPIPNVAMALRVSTLSQM